MKLSCLLEHKESYLVHLGRQQVDDQSSWREEHFVGVRRTHLSEWRNELQPDISLVSIYTYAWSQNATGTISNGGLCSDPVLLHLVDCKYEYHYLYEFLGWFLSSNV